MSDEPAQPVDDSVHRRGLRFRRRDDYAVNLFREARGHLGDVRRVDRILLELGRFYNPLTDNAIVDPPTRRRILDLIQAGEVEEAGRLLDERLFLYTTAMPAEAGGDGAGEEGR